MDEMLAGAGEEREARGKKWAPKEKSAGDR
jgi:hypothetical protein